MKGSKITLIALILLSATQGFSQSKELSFRVWKKYIQIPIQMSQERQEVKFMVDGELLTTNDIRVARDKVDYWTFVDVSKFRTKKISFEFSEYTPGVELIHSDTIVGQDLLYKEKYRPQLHFTTRRGWNNDPNGMVCYKGEYHLYYQHNPYETKWGNMTWGHAVSRDLVHWKELSIALEPDELGTMFSGSAVIDHDNTSGFGEGSKVPLVAIYTANGEEKQQQCIAYSLDKGRTFTKYEGNPVIPATRRFGSGHERDPKVFWYKPGNHWVLVMHDALNYSIYNSKNLKDWEYQSSVDAGFWECPELFEMAVDGNQENRKWVMYGVRGTYLIGEFDGKVFKPETGMLRYNVGGMTAAQTYNDEPNRRRLQIGWGHAEFPGMPFAQTFTMVQEYSLKSTAEGIRLFIEPAREIEKLYTKSHVFADEFIGEEINEKLAAITTPLLHIKATFEIDNCRSFGMDINGYKINYRVDNHTLNDHFLPLQDRQLQLEVIVDKTIVEVYGNGGLIYWFDNHITDNPDEMSISIFQDKNGLNPQAKTLVKSLEINELSSIWNP